MKNTRHFFIMYLPVLLRMGNVSEKFVEEIKTHIFMSHNFFLKIVPIMK